MDEKPVSPLVAIKTVAGHIAQKAIRKGALVKHGTGVRNGRAHLSPLIEWSKVVECPIVDSGMVGAKVAYDGHVPDVASKDVPFDSVGHGYVATPLLFKDVVEFCQRAEGKNLDKRPNRYLPLEIQGLEVRYASFLGSVQFRINVFKNVWKLSLVCEICYLPVSKSPISS